jgi:hypothetical protein
MRQALSLSCSVAILIATSSCSERTFPSRIHLNGDQNAPGLATRDLTPVELVIKAKDGDRVEPEYGQVVVRLPKAYLPGPDQWKGNLGPLSQLTVEAALPDLSPWTVFGEQLYAELVESQSQLLKSDQRAFQAYYDRKFFSRWVTVRMSYGHCRGLSKSMPQYIQRWATASSAPTVADLDRFDGGRPGVSLRTWYVPKVQSPYQLFIECPESQDDFARCTVRTDLSGLVALEYLIPRAELSKYKDIDAKVRAFAASFVVQERKAPTMPSTCD